MLTTSFVVFKDGPKELLRLISLFPTEVLPSTSPSEVFSMKPEITNLLVSETSESSPSVALLLDANKSPTNSTNLLLLILKTGLMKEVLLSPTPSLLAPTFPSLVVSRSPFKRFMMVYSLTLVSEFSSELLPLVTGVTLLLVSKFTSMKFWLPLKSLPNSPRIRFVPRKMKVSETTTLMFLTPALFWIWSSSPLTSKVILYTPLEIYPSPLMLKKVKPSSALNSTKSTSTLLLVGLLLVMLTTSLPLSAVNTPSLVVSTPSVRKPALLRLTLLSLLTTTLSSLSTFTSLIPGIEKTSTFPSMVPSLRD